MLRDNGKNTGRQSHVEKPMGLFSSLLEVFQMLVEMLEGLVSVILSRYIGAERAELLQLLLNILGRRLDIRLDPAQVLIMIHLGTSIADNLDVLGKELIPVLQLGLVAPFARPRENTIIPGQREPGT